MTWVIGVDEVGRGPLAGPVYVGGVLVEKPKPGEQWPVLGVRDSKKLTPAKRTLLSRQLQDHPSVHAFYTSASNVEIDTRGIVPCLGDCFRRAIDTLLFIAERDGRKVEAVLIDGKPLWTPKSLTGNYDVPVNFIVKGDDKEWSIGAASIVAKDNRDRHMENMAGLHPVYGWERNSGYGTAEHIAAIKQHGLSPLHRATFCKDIIGGGDDVFEMFSNDGV